MTPVVNGANPYHGTGIGGGGSVHGQFGGSFGADADLGAYADTGGGTHTRVAATLLLAGIVLAGLKFAGFRFNVGVTS